MTRRTLAAALLATAAAAPLALAAAPAKDPVKLVLQKSDVPAGATASGAGQTIPAGIAKTSTVTFNFRNGAGEEEVTSTVSVSTNPQDAATQYRIQIGAYTGVKGDTVLQLPAYGDEQRADFINAPQFARSQIIVRKNNTVWTLMVENCGPLASYSCFHGRTPPKITSAQALPELKKYASRQKARIGNG